MKSEVIESTGLKRKLKIDFDNNEVLSAMETEFKKVQKRVHLKGFRKGKAPLDQVKAMYSGEVSQTVLEGLINKGYFQALTEHDIVPLDQPHIDVGKDGAFNQEGQVSFTAEVEIRPDITLQDPSKVTVTKDTASIDAEKINQEIETQRQRLGDLKDIQEDRAAKQNDWVKIDFDGFLPEQNKPVENGSAQDFSLELGSKSLITGFEDGIVGMKKGEEKTLKLNFPDDYFKADLASAPVEFKVTLKAVCTKELPELNDEALLNALSTKDAKTIEEAKEEILARFTEQAENQVENKLNADLIEAFSELHSFDLPESTIEKQAEDNKKMASERLRMQGLKDEEIEDYHKKWADDYVKDAKKSVRIGFVMDKLASSENLYPTEEDFSEYYAELSERVNLDLEKIKAYYQQDGKQRDLTFQLMEKKVVAFLKSKATIK